MSAVASASPLYTSLRVEVMFWWMWRMVACPLHHENLVLRCPRWTSSYARVCQRSPSFCRDQGRLPTPSCTWIVPGSESAWSH